MSADSPTPTPILSRDKWHSALSLACQGGEPVARTTACVMLREHDQALRDAVAVLTEERNEYRRRWIQWEQTDENCPHAARVAVLEAGLRDASNEGRNIAPAATDDVAHEIETWAAVLLGGTE